ncbi:MAG: hypothetical protein KGO51_00420, partial [Alphaproteobacteria bacterium]|nr:hypothetical protein [Alphaproteobacteria bacterium]
MQAARRQLLFGVGAAAAAVAVPTVLESANLKRSSLAAPAIINPRQTALAASAAELRRVSLHNLHTGDKFDEVYWQNGTYVP